MPLIRAQSLSKSFRASIKEPGFVNTLRHFFRRRYRTIDAVKAVSFEIEPGQIVGFLGPNGAGKTTTLKMLTGLIHPTAGLIDVGGFTPYRRQAGFLRRITLVMGNKQQLLWDLPVIDSLRVNAAVYEVPRAECQSRINDLADMLGLDKQLTQPVRKLSLGERMKAELLASLLHRPDVLFLDEPTLGLDVNAQVSVREFLREYNRRFGATVLLTSHYMADITALCPRVLLIHQGTLVYDGSLTSIIERFAPFREVKVELARPADPAALARYGEIEHCQGREARLIVGRDKLTATVARLLSEVEVLDLTVTDPPVEQIIGRIFLDGVVAGQNPARPEVAAAPGGAA